MNLRPLCVGLAVFFAAAGCKREEATPALRLGFFPNVTHAQALVGNHRGTFAEAISPTPLQIRQFNAGPAAMEALLSGSLDVSYVGSGPAINTYLKADKGLRVIAGAVNGGAVLVTRTARTPQELRGKKIASPQLGNSQDIALRHWLKTQKLDDVAVTPISNADILALFQSGALEGAWVPEPWGARLVTEAGGKILLDERDLWPDGTFATTVLVTTDKYMKSHRRELKALVAAHVALTEAWRKDPAAFVDEVGVAFQKLTAHKIERGVLDQAFSRMQPATMPPVKALTLAAEHAQALGFAPKGSIDGLIDLSLLVSAAGTRTPEGVGGAGPESPPDPHEAPPHTDLRK